MVLRMASGLALIAVLVGCQTGCFLAVVGGAGAEAGYVASQKDRSGGETMSDQWIHTKVKAALLAEKGVDSTNIDVDVYKGEVTLKGVLPSEQAKQSALRAAAGVAGVKKVSDRLFVVK